MQEASCKLVLTELRRESDSRLLLSDERIQLAASNLDIGDRYADQIIGSDDAGFFDLVQTVRHDPERLIVSARERSGGQTQFSEVFQTTLTRGIYSLRIRSIGRNCDSGHWRVKVKFDGWPNLEVIGSLEKG